MSPTTSRLTVSDWQAELSRHQAPRTFGPESAALDVLRHRFREISTRTRAHRQADWISQPGYAALRKTSDEALELTRLGFQELSRFDEPDAATIPLHSLNQLLVENQNRLAEIDIQLELIQASVSLAELLRPATETLLESTGMPSAKWNSLIDQLIASRLPERCLSIVPWPGVSLERIFEAEHWAYPWFYAPAIHRAGWMAALHGVMPELQPYPRDSLILAALLADSGLTLLGRGEPNTRSPSPGSAGYRRHPEMSAALIGTMSDVSPLCAVLAGQHHERIDGAGYPRRLRDQSLSRPSRCFATIARWAELLLQTPAATSSQDITSHAAMCLWRETLLGAYESHVVSRLLTAIRPDLPAAVNTAVRNGTKLMLHTAQPLNGPHHKPATAAPAPVRIIDAAEPTPAPAMLHPRISAFKTTGPGALRTPPPRPARTGN